MTPTNKTTTYLLPVTFGPTEGLAQAIFNHDMLHKQVKYSLAGISGGTAFVIVEDNAGADEASLYAIGVAFGLSRYYRFDKDRNVTRVSLVDDSEQCLGKLREVTSQQAKTGAEYFFDGEHYFAIGAA